MPDSIEEQTNKQPNVVVRFYRRIVAILKGYLLFVGVMTTLSFALSFWLVLRSDSMLNPQMMAPSFERMEKLVLTLDLDRRVSDKSPSSEEVLYSQLFGGKVPLSLNDIGVVLRRAKDDPRVEGIRVNLGPLAASGANLYELRKLFADFKESKKPLWIHATSPNSGRYYFASVASLLTIEPSDSVEVTGPIMLLTYFKGALDKLGVEFEVIRAGKFKSAMEPMILNEPSAATEEMYGAINQSLVDHYVMTVAPARKKEAAEVEAWLKSSLFSAQEALGSGLVDRVGFYSDLEKEFMAPFKDPRVASFKDYLAGSSELDAPITEAGTDKIGIIDAFGNIVLNAPEGSSDPAISPEAMNKRLRWMADSEDVKAVVIRVSSPGGSAVASDMIWYEMKRLAAKKPVVVSMGSIAASGGYYLAAPATKIFADPNTITGSIGVFSGLPNFASFKEKYGVSFFAVGPSQHKNIYNPGSPLSDDDKKMLQSHTDQVYDLFLARVAEGRSKTKEEIHELGQGRVYTGTEALNLGLVDQVGGMREALAEAKSLGGLDPNKLYPVARYIPEPKTAFDCLRLDTSDMMECIGKLQSVMPDPQGLWHMSERGVIPSALHRLEAWLKTLEEEPVQALYTDGLFLSL